MPHPSAESSRVHVSPIFFDIENLNVREPQRASHVLPAAPRVDRHEETDVGAHIPDRSRLKWIAQNRVDWAVRQIAADVDPLSLFRTLIRAIEQVVDPRVL